jgi:hypothetical protein
MMDSPERAMRKAEGWLASARDKSGADYGKKEFSYAEAEEYVEKAEEFVGMARARI